MICGTMICIDKSVFLKCLAKTSCGDVCYQDTLQNMCDENNMSKKEVFTKSVFTKSVLTKSVLN
jgi:hypothetical protein